LLREDACKLNFCIKVVVSLEVLSKFWSPLSLELLGYSSNADGINFDVDFWDKVNVVTVESAPAAAAAPSRPHGEVPASAPSASAPTFWNASARAKSTPKVGVTQVKNQRRQE
jgi:hypothetical protein